MTGEILLQIVMAMIGALGFGLLFHISGSRLITIMLGAAVNWGVYLLAMQWYDNRVTAFFVSTLATAALAEVLARLLKAPVITLLKNADRVRAASLAQLVNVGRHAVDYGQIGALRLVDVRARIGEDSCLRVHGKRRLLGKS